MKAIDLHDRIMRSKMAEFNGFEVQTEGDAFVIAFHEAGEHGCPLQLMMAQHQLATLKCLQRCVKLWTQPELSTQVLESYLPAVH